MTRIQRLVTLALFSGFVLGMLAMSLFVACIGPWR